MIKRGAYSFQLIGGKPFTRLLGDTKKLRGLKAGLVVLKPGENVGCHNTEHKEEALVILGGTASVYCAGKKFVLKAPAFLFIPPATHHNVENRGKKPLRYVYVTAPA